MTFPFTFKMEQILHNESIGLTITESLKEGDSTGRDYAWETTNIAKLEESDLSDNILKDTDFMFLFKGSCKITYTWDEQPITQDDLDKLEDYYLAEKSDFSIEKDLANKKFVITQKYIGANTDWIDYNPYKYGLAIDKIRFLCIEDGTRYLCANFNPDEVHDWSMKHKDIQPDETTTVTKQGNTDYVVFTDDVEINGTASTGVVAKKLESNSVEVKNVSTSPCKIFHYYKGD